MNIPIIKLEVEGMKYTVLQALMQHSAQMDASVQAAVEAYCTEGNLDDVIRGELRKCMNSAVSEEVQRFFGYAGAGRQAIREAVLKYLNDVYPAEPAKQRGKRRAFT